MFIYYISNNSIQYNFLKMNFVLQVRDEMLILSIFCFRYLDYAQSSELTGLIKAKRKILFKFCRAYFMNEKVQTINLYKIIVLKNGSMLKTYFTQL